MYDTTIIRISCIVVIGSTHLREQPAALQRKVRARDGLEASGRAADRVDHRVARGVQAHLESGLGFGPGFE